MNVYDFDKTIFQKDSSEAFLLYCLRRAPRMVIQPALPKLRLFLNYYTQGREDASAIKDWVHWETCMGCCLISGRRISL